MNQLITTTKYFFEGLKAIDYFKQPVQLLVSRKGARDKRHQREEIGSTWGGFLTIISFSFLLYNGYGRYLDMMSGNNDIIKNEIE